MKRRKTYQERAIENYYRHRPQILLQRLTELVSELYLAEGAARKRLWDRAAQALAGLGVSQSRIEHLVKTDNPSYLANLVSDLLARQ